MALFAKLTDETITDSVGEPGTTPTAPLPAFSVKYSVPSPYDHPKSSLTA